MDKYFTIQEVAEALKVTVQTVRNWIKSGELNSVKLKHSIRITEADLKDFVSKNN
ncbi:MAG: helix-turn-helix domain-containing protein [Candidatus Absconditabacterales bacterium]|nr:helix-turn-helix domain-containing protein [Candidatus Absconditabacterales bacterium]